MARFVRVIPLVLYDGQVAVKTVRFQHRRNIGSLRNIARLYQERQVDELVFLDISDRKEPDYETISTFAVDLFSPFSVGGNVRNMEHVDRLLDSGVDKIVIPSRHGGLIEQAVDKHGRQAVIMSVDDGKIPNIKTGEILLQSRERDGTMLGYDTAAMDAIAEPIPIILGSGAGNPEHCVEAVEAGASAVACSSIFHFTEYTPLNIKECLDRSGYTVRLETTECPWP